MSPLMRVRHFTAWCLLLLPGLLTGCTYTITPYKDGSVPAADPIVETEVDHRLLLIGDAGDPDPDGEPALMLVRDLVQLLPARTTVVFLGDNVYERGMPAPIKKEERGLDEAADVADEFLPDLFPSRIEAERNLNAQLEVVLGTQSRAIFIPGNHDWDQFEIGGWERILALEKYINAAARAGLPVALLPQGGCPGPSWVRLGSKADLMIIDTQWWLETRADGKPTADNNPTRCPYVTEGDVRAAMLDGLKKSARQGRWVIVAGHHPLATRGPHGGFADLRTHLFPLRIIGPYLPAYLEWLPFPGLGSAIVGLRACCSPSAQDMPNRRNRHMRRAILQPMMEAQEFKGAPLLYAAGHDHSLQIFRAARGPRFTLVSGLGSSAKASDVGRSDDTIFAHANPFQPGIMQVDFLRDGRARLAVMQRSGEQTEEVFSFYLTNPHERPGRAS
jgi:hypothetical protein